MTAFVLSVPFTLRMLAWFLVGAVLGSVVNFVVDRLRWDTPRVSPWNDVVDRWWARRRGKQPVASKGRTVRWLDFVPIIGWRGGFWRRHRLVEILCGVALAGLYWWEVGQWRLIPGLLTEFDPPPANPSLPMAHVLHVQYIKHAILIVFMLAASLIDLDEWIIPDWIAIPGTLIALALAALFPLSLLIDQQTPGWLLFVNLAAPGAWPATLNVGEPSALWVALGCWWLWCFALMRRTLRLRRGLAVALRLFWRRLATRATLGLLLMGAAGTGVVALLWKSDALRWAALLTALVGMAVGGGLTWSIRFLCSAVLRREAMGFGDVTLMAMIGAFLGWQAAVLVFFLSPFFGLLPPILALFSRNKVPPALPFGPFLCLGAMTVLLLWAPLWEWVRAVVAPVFWMLVYEWGWGPQALGIVIVSIVVLLLLLQLIKRAVGWQT